MSVDSNTTSNKEDQQKKNDEGAVAVPSSVTDVSPPQEDGAVQSPAQPENYSLNSVYGNKLGFLQSASLLLNAALMVYAHVGLSGVFLSNQENVETDTTAANVPVVAAVPSGGGGVCTPEDQELWLNGGGAILKPDQLTFCATGFPHGTVDKPRTGCLFTDTCTTECFTSTYSYSEACSACFSTLPMCNFQAGCAGVCSGKNVVREECDDCTKDCDAVFFECSGFPNLDVTTLTLPPELQQAEVEEEVTTTESESSAAITGSSSNEQVCAIQSEGVSYEDVDEYHKVYELMFVDGVEEAWNGNARLLAVIVVIFSGIWPYTKNLILMLAWYLPLSEIRRSKILLWLRRLGKYTLVDVYVVIALIVGVMVELNVSNGTVPLIIKGEPRFAIIAFLLATLWEFFHIEWMTHCHQSRLHLASQQQPNNANNANSNVLDTLQFKGGPNTTTTTMMCQNPALLRGLVGLLWLVSLVLFIAGTAIENIRFISILPDEDLEVGCVTSYNLYTFGTAMVSDFGMHLNTSKGMVWILYLSYIVLLAISPLFVHLVQALVVVGGWKDKRLCLAADAIWTFASVDVYLLALFVVQYKFTEMMEQMAGNEGSQFFTIKAELGPGFAVLICYSIFAGIFQWIFNCAVASYHHIDVLDRRIPSVGGICGGCLVPLSQVEGASNDAGTTTASGGDNPKILKNATTAEEETEDKTRSDSPTANQTANAASEPSDDMDC